VDCYLGFVSPEAANSTNSANDRCEPLMVALGRDMIAIGEGSLTLIRKRFGLRFERVIARESVVSLAYSIGPFPAFQLRLQNPKERIALGPGMRPYAAELAIQKLEQSGSWMAHALERTVHGVFQTSPAAQ
jgi:hypothetical protein